MTHSSGDFCAARAIQATWHSGSLQDARLSAVHDALLMGKAETVLDLGCGPGPLLLRVAAQAQFRHVVGVDKSAEALRILERRLAAVRSIDRRKVKLMHADFIESAESLRDFDAAVLVETIEHIEPNLLSGVERAVFARARPKSVIITTPNRECNELLGVPSHRYRHVDHRFEWGRRKFRSWSRGLASRHGYTVSFGDIGQVHPSLGAPTQMATFSLACEETRRGA